MAVAKTDRETVSEVIQGFEEDSKHHDAWVTKVDSWYKSWRGIQEVEDNWRSNLHPPYILQIIETLVGGVIEPNPTWRVKARQRMTTQEELQSMREGAKSLEILLDAQRDTSGMIALQRWHRLQGLIAGMTVWKTYWTLKERTVKRTQKITEQDEFGWPREVEQEVEVMEPTEDDPGLECVDVRDWIPHEAARDVETMKRCHHRVWMSFDDLMELQKQGVYKNVAGLEPKSFTDALASRELEIHQADRTKDLIEVVEHWIEGGKRVVTTANRNVLLADRDNPFDHGQFPFIVCGPIPDLFRLQGVSIVEIVQDLQEMLWTLQNQRLDNLELLNNLVLKVREGSTFNTPVLGPGEQWLMDDLSAVEPLNMPTFPAEVSLQSEGLIKADIQNIPGASPALLGQADSVEQTATEVSLLTNLAQRRLAAQKFQFTLADKKVGEQWIELNKQFLTEPRYVSIVGEDGEEGWELIHPESFVHHDWKIEIDQMDESLLRQERLAEAQARFQIALSAVPAMAQMQMPLNMKAFMEDILQAGGATDTDRYFSSQPQQMPPEMPGQPGIPGQNGNGVTNPELAAGQMSPSNAESMSPVASLQRQGAMSGGSANSERY